MSKEEGLSKKTKLSMPHSLVIMVFIVMLAGLLTWIIPAGEFKRAKDAITGQNLIVAEEFNFIENRGVNLFTIPLRLVKGLVGSADIIILVLVAGGAFSIIIKTGMVQAMTSKLTKIFSNKEFLIIPAFTTIFAFSCMTIGVNTFIGFAPLGIIIARSLGYDAIIGVAMICLGGAVGFSTGTFNPYTTGVAQAIAGLPLFSGLWFRIISWFVFLVVTNIYIIWYAKRVKKNPEFSVVREMEIEAQKQELKADESVLTEMHYRHYLVGLVVLLGFGLIVFGGWKLDYGLQETTAVFMWMAFLAGIAGGFGINTIAKEFIAGAKGLVFGAFLVGFARSISGVLADGKILDTTIYYLSNVLSSLPNSMQACTMFLIQLVVNGLITSGSGQASATMPIMIPVGDIVGITRQTVILAFNFGDGLSNYVIPMSSALMGFLGVANIGYDKWMKFMWKLFVMWIITGMILVTIANAIHYQ